MPDQAEKLRQYMRTLDRTNIPGKGDVPVCCDLCGSDTPIAEFEYEDMHWVSEDKQESQGTRITSLCQLCGDNPKLKEAWLDYKSHGNYQDKQTQAIINHCAVANASLNLALNQINDMFLDHLDTLRH